MIEVRYAIEWEEQNGGLKVYLRTSPPDEEGTPLSKYEGNAKFLRKSQVSKSSLVVGCLIRGLNTNYWTWDSLGNVLVDTFRGVESPLWTIAKDCPFEWLNHLHLRAFNTPLVYSFKESDA